MPTMPDTLNRAPVAQGSIPPQTITAGQSAAVNVASNFSDPDGDPLTYEAVTSDAGVAGVSVAGATITIAAVAAGNATITVTVRDPGGFTAVLSFGVTVYVAGAPDLVVESPSVSDGSPDVGAFFTLSATVRNRGDGSSAATTLRYYRSTDAAITIGDTPVGTDAVGALSASSTSDEAIRLTAPASAGTYYYGACVESVTGERDTGNNCSSAVTVTVGVAGAPDLVVESPSVSDGSPDVGAAFTLSATVRNRGDGSSAATTLRYYRSTDATITIGDTPVGTDAVRALSASSTSDEAIRLTAPASAGTYYYGACVESVTGERDTGNNCSSAVTVTVGVAGAPDLVVESPSVSDGSPDVGAAFTLSATVRNRGDGSSATTTLRYYRSTDAAITTGDTPVGTDAVGTLSASSTSDEAIRLTAPASAGTYYYGACVESVTGESDTGNNCSSAVTVTVGVAGAPDLVVESPSVSDGSPDAGAAFTLSATVRNQGDGSSAATTLRYYRSTDAAITIGDTPVGTDAVGALSASSTSDEAIRLTAPASAGTYYYGACVESVTGESDTGNNCSSAVTVTVGVAGAPDLVVESPSVSDGSPDVGAFFTLSATVRNRGDGSSAATTLRYYRSTDAAITIGDTPVGTDAVGTLSASSTSDEWISLTAPASAGTYYYGACVESVTGESDTGNNCSSAVTVTVGVAGAPDLVVSSPSVSDGSPDVGAAFTLSATVRNRGDGSSATTTLRYYRSTDAAITIGDTPVGTDAVGTLSASSTSDEWIRLTAPASAGTYYYGACVESVTGESDTGNNCSSAVTVTVGVAGAPDLVVESPSVSDGSPDAGAAFTLSATVRNQGTASSAATTLRYYRSTDAAITIGDTPVGTDAVGALSASSTSDEAIRLTAPASAGTYYYGACVESVTGESDTGNNCSSAVTVTVGVAGAPDLVVESPSVSDSSPDAGASFTLSATVRNRGDGSSAATTLRYYRSTDAAITTGDTQVGTDAVRALSASSTSDEWISLTAPASAGTYYYGACVESVTGESNTTNNCSSAVTVTVGAATAPDLVVESPSVSDGSPDAGASFTLSATVRNQGDGSSAATTLRYYRSTDAAITTGDTQVGTDAVRALSASSTSDEWISLTAPASAGTYYYGACVESVTGESNITNNCSSAVTVTVGAATAPDLVVESPSVSDSSPDAGASFTLSATVRNRGDGSSATTTLRYYRSTDAAISSTDTEVGTDAVGALSASGTSDESIDLTAPASPGTYYYGACVNSVTGESDTSNNCSSAVTVTIRAPDLVVESPSVSDSSPVTGASFTLSATVRNQGDGSSAATTLRYYRSADATISSTDTEVGTDAVSALSASGTSDESIDLTAPSSAGTYYYGACVDDVTGESDTSNNCSSAVTIAVGVPPAPDLVVGSPSVSNSSPLTGASFTLSATVRNQGSGPSAATTLRYYRSTDATISGTDTQVGTDAVGSLAASGTSDESIGLTAPASVGTYYYGACVDAVTGESDTSNNCSDAVTVTVGAPPPDLVVGSPSVSNSSPVTGASFTLSATVRNQGDGSSAATTLRYYRSINNRISTSDTEVGTDAVGALSASATSDESIDLTAPSSPGTYYYGACVDSVTDESDTSNNCSSAVTVTVVSQANRAPVAVGTIPSQTIEVNRWSIVTLTSYFNDPDSDRLDYSFATSKSIVATATSQGTRSVRITGHGDGTATITVTARDPGGLEATQTISVTVGAGGVPDLVVESPSVSNSSPVTGASFTLGATVRNQGDGLSPATTLRYYRSTDATITTSDTEVGTDAVGALGPSGFSNLYIGLTAPLSAGTYYYGACVESVTDESDTSNNCSSAVTVTVVVAAPDLVVGSPSVSDSSPGTGASFTLSATVRNQGNTSSAATTLRYYRSTDATISTSDTEVGTDAVGALSASATSDESIGLTAPASTGTYYYGACVDSVTDESDTSNNCSSAVTVTVVVAAPDLVVASPSVSDSSPDTGASFTLSATVRNQGNTSSAATTLRYYRSTDATITTSDTEVGTDAVGALSASGTSDESIGLTAPSSPGTYYYGACVDAVTGESDTSNNCSSAVTVTVIISVGNAVTGSITTCAGNQVGPSLWSVTIAGTLTAVRSVRAVRVEGSLGGVFVGFDYIGDMAPGESVNFSIAGYFTSLPTGSCGVSLEWIEIGSSRSQVGSWELSLPQTR